jgi:hypothetical protein
VQYQVPIRVRDSDQVSTKEKQTHCIACFYRSLMIKNHLYNYSYSFFEKGERGDRRKEA